MSFDSRHPSPSAESGGFTLRVILPLLAILAVLFAPLARPLHESLEASAAAAAHAQAIDHDHSENPHPVHHDSSHCSMCASIGTLRLVSASSAFLFAQTHEPAPLFVIPSYLAPTTHEPAIALAVPRGPPMSV